MTTLSLVASVVTGNASEGLLASVVTGLVTIIVTLIGVLATRVHRERKQTNESNPAPVISDPLAVAEIKDLRRQRDTLQRKFDSELAENERLRSLLWNNHINPYTGDKVT